MCRETKDIFMVQCKENRRDRKTLEDIITTHVHKGSTIYTDGWAAYTHLEELGYGWNWVNHSENFIKVTLYDYFFY